MQQCTPLKHLSLLVFVLSIFFSFLTLSAVTSTATISATACPISATASDSTAAAEISPADGAAT